MQNNSLGWFFSELNKLQAFWLGLAMVSSHYFQPSRLESFFDHNDKKFSQKGKLYKFIRVFLAISIFMLFFEVFAHVKGWRFDRPSYLHIPDSSDVQSLLQSTYIGWVDFRANYLGPPLQTLANSCIVLFLIQSIDRLIQCLGCLWIWVKKIKPIAKVKDFETNDPEQPFSAYPMVMVQIPMCNEKEVLVFVHVVFCFLHCVC